MTTEWDGLEKGTAVLMRCVSHFNEDVTHTIPGVVTDVDDGHGVAIEGDEGEYWVTWDGGVDRATADSGARYSKSWDPYGGDARLWALDPVNPLTDDLDEEELIEGDKRPVDPLLDEGNLADDIIYQETNASTE